jgi:hypothetical protein
MRHTEGKDRPQFFILSGLFPFYLYEQGARTV